ncbi:hypothetical protein HPSA_06880 [Helicobacter pylori SouthAfrica7]|uniref:Uncharacterized protein n=1 Tax=Helicobacter pylori (strain SouthAfrica7) TaxID=907239 RepID=E8QTW8_HELPW|nr:hypothetical protein HPSA_06880 [Helicobacter pylori SouthAfrica7]
MFFARLMQALLLVLKQSLYFPCQTPHKSTPQ